MKSSKILVILFSFILAGLASGQYSNETVLEKTFETSPFFFRSTRINPYGLGDFGSTAVGLINQPLLNLQLNPAFASTGTKFKGYTYLNFRNSKQIKSSNNIYPAWNKCYFAPYPSASTSSKALEPLISAAAFIRPFKINQKPLTLGLTYQVIFQDDKYQHINNNIYRSSPGLDFAGNKTAQVAETDITDRYSGRDDMHSEAHFLTFFAALPLNNRISLGLGAGINNYSRDGGLANTYQWDNGMFDDEISRNSTSLTRTQNYRHSDFSAGLNFQLNKKSILGVVGGILSGKADQTLNKKNSYFYQSGKINQTKNWSHYLQNSSTAQTWQHQGRSLYGGFNFQHQISKNKLFVLYYKGRQQKTDITLTSNIADSSSSNYHYKNKDWESTSTSKSHLFDQRNGSGDKTGWSHQAAATLRWKTGPGTRVSFGINVQMSNMETATTEAVLADRYSSYNNLNQSREWHYLNSVTEDKTLEWRFKSRVTTIQIPIIIHHRLNAKSELIFGLTRRMSRWALKDETLALFSFREEKKIDETSKKENFGERYRQPDEIESNVSTSLIFGYTLSPSDHLKIRFLTMPQFTRTWNGTTFSKFQWWINFQLIN